MQPQAPSRHPDGAAPLQPLPHWQRIIRVLREEIVAGSFAAGSQLPSEKLLCQRFGVTRMTIRQALGVLEREGWLTPRKGIGVFVRGKPTQYQINDGKRFADNIASIAGPLDTRTLSLERRAATAIEAAPLHLPVGAELVVVLRVRLIAGVPVFLNCKHFPAERFPRFASVYEIAQSVAAVFEAHGVGAYRRLETRISGGTADAMEAEHLGLPLGGPLLRSQSINADAKGRIVEFSRGCWPLNAVEFVFKGRQCGSDAEMEPDDHA